MANPAYKYETLCAKLTQSELSADAADIHGILCGMLSGGMSVDDQSWLTALSDVTNQGEAFPAILRDTLVELFSDTCQQLVEPDFALQLCLPDDSAPINDRASALINWVNGFLLGFGLHQADLTACSEDVKEALEDFSEIAKLDEQMENTEEDERSLLEVSEYVRITTMLCFNELGKSPFAHGDDTPSVH